PRHRGYSAGGRWRASQCDLALGNPGVNADAPQRIEVQFDPVAARSHRKEVREALGPQPATTGYLGGHAVARADGTREPGPARVLGQVDDEAIASVLQIA